LLYATFLWCVFIIYICTFPFWRNYKENWYAKPFFVHNFVVSLVHCVASLSTSDAWVSGDMTHLAKETVNLANKEYEKFHHIPYIFFFFWSYQLLHLALDTRLVPPLPLLSARFVACGTYDIRFVGSFWLLAVVDSGCWLLGNFRLLTRKRRNTIVKCHSCISVYVVVCILLQFGFLYEAFFAVVPDELSYKTAFVCEYFILMFQEVLRQEWVRNGYDKATSCRI